METGKVIRIDKDDPNNTSGFTYDLYIPDNVQQDSPVHLYIPGAGGSGRDIKALTNFANTNKPNSVVIMPIWSNVGSKMGNYSETMLKVSDSVIKQYNLNPSFVSVSGFSNGGTKSGYTAYLSWADNHTTKVNSFAVIDGGFGLNDEQVKLLVDNDVTLYSCVRSGGVDGPGYAQKYVDAGGTALVIRGKGLGHVELNDNLYNCSLVNFLNGTGDLGGLETFTFSMYNHDTNKWEELSYEQVKAKVESGELNSADIAQAIGMTGAYSTPVASDNEVLKGYLTAIDEKLKSTGFYSVSFHEYGSTTATPSNSTEVAIEFFTATDKFLALVASDLRYIGSVGDALVKLDEDLAKRLSSVPTAPWVEAGTTEVTAGAETGAAATGTKINILDQLATDLKIYTTTGALIGVTAGSVIPGLGSALGLAGGFLAGAAVSIINLIGNLIHNAKVDKAATAAQPQPGPTPTPAPTPTPTPSPTDMLGAE